MYSMVLLMAMSTSPEATATHGKSSGCNGCHGTSCHGTVVVVHGCNGSSCHGCNGSSCNGCNGGCHGKGFLGMRNGGLFKKRGGFLGGCHGCHGGSSCHGSSCNGCTGGTGCTGSAPVIVHPTTEPKMEPKVDTKPKEMPKKVEGKLGSINATNYGLIAVNVPADARVTVNGLELVTKGDLRYFATRELNATETVSYTVVAEVVREGKTVSSTETVAVKAGETTTVTLNPQSTSLVSK